MNISWFVFGMICFLCGQVVRAVRWQILLPQGASFKKNRLVLYTSIGSLINMLVPLRMGDLIRCALLAKIENIRFTTSIISVLTERLTDIIFLLLFLSIFNFYFPNFGINISNWMLWVAGLILIVSTLVNYSSKFRRWIYAFSLLWNQKIQVSLLDLFWVLALQIKHAQFLSRQYVAATVVMWALYFSSYLRRYNFNFFFVSSLTTSSIV